MGARSIAVAATDCGPVESGLVVMRFPEYEIISAKYDHNDYVELELTRLARFPVDFYASEWLEFYARLVNANTFETAFVAGRFSMLWEIHRNKYSYAKIKKPDISYQLCGRRQGVKNPQTKAAVISRAGCEPGTRKKPDAKGLYMLNNNHLWDAAAVAIAWWEIQQEQEKEYAF